MRTSVGTRSPTGRGPVRKYHPQLLARIVRSLWEGQSKNDCFKRAGVHPDTGYLWLKQGRDGHDELLARFERAAEKAVALFNARQLRMIDGAAQSGSPNTWQAAAWLLERRDPENWGRRDKTTIEHEGAPLFQLNQVVLADGEARDQARALLGRVADPGAYKSIGPGVRDESEEESGAGGVPVEVDPRPARRSPRRVPRQTS